MTDFAALMKEVRDQQGEVIAELDPSGDAQNHLVRLEIPKVACEIGIENLDFDAPKSTIAYSVALENNKAVDSWSSACSARSSRNEPLMRMSGANCQEMRCNRSDWSANDGIPMCSHSTRVRTSTINDLSPEFTAAQAA